MTPKNTVPPGLQAENQKTLGQVMPKEALILLPLLTFFWGVNWPIMKIGLQDFDVMTFRTLNVSASAVGFFVIAYWGGGSLWPSVRDWKGLIPAALLAITGWNAFILLGVAEMASGRAAILGYTMPIWATALSVVVAKAQISGRQILGLALGLAGMLVLIIEDLSTFGANPWASLSCLLAAFTWGAGTVYVRHYGFEVSTMVMTAWLQAIGVVPIAIYAALFSSWDFSEVSLGPALSLAYNCTIAGVFCFYAYYRIASLVPVVISSVSTLFIPVLGVIFGVLMLNEQPGWAELASLFLVAAAIFAVISGRRA